MTGPASKPRTVADVVARLQSARETSSTHDVSQDEERPHTAAAVMEKRRQLRAARAARE